MKAVVVGSMNCMPTEYAIILKKYCAEVVHFYDAGRHDTLSNPTIRWGEKSAARTRGIELKRIVFRHHLSYLLPGLFHRELIAQLNSADLIILSGPGISLARLLKNTGKKIVALSYGNDVSFFCNRSWPEISLSEVRGPKRLFIALLRLLKSRFVELQIEGLRSCTHYSYFIEGMDPEIDNMLRTLLAGVEDQIRLPRYSINTDMLEDVNMAAPPPESADGYKILFPVRFSAGHELLGNKGWRLLFDGLVKYKAASKTKFVCTCFKKGDYLEAQAYVRMLGLEEVVLWHEVVPFDALVEMYKSSDVIVEQLGSHIVGQGLYVMALGKPVIARLSTKGLEEFFADSGLLPVEDVDSLVRHLVDCESAGYRNETGRKSREFVHARASIEAEVIGWGIL